MTKLMISAAALIAVAAFVTVPASAEHLGGGPRQQNGKCWNDHGGGHDARYGVWSECPKAASINDSTCQTMGQLEWEKKHVGFQYFDVCGANAKGGKGAAGANSASTGTVGTQKKLPTASR